MDTPEEALSSKRDVDPAVDSAGVYYMSVEDFERRSPSEPGAEDTQEEAARPTDEPKPAATSG